MYHLSHVQVYNSAILNAFTLLCDHHTVHLQNSSSCRTETLSPSDTHSPPPPQPRPLTDTICFLSL